MFDYFLFKTQIGHAAHVSRCLAQVLKLCEGCITLSALAQRVRANAAHLAVAIGEHMRTSSQASLYISSFEPFLTNTQI